jgi:RNA polymerase sigma-70 factor (ECF subfamily)
MPASHTPASPSLAQAIAASRPLIVRQAQRMMRRDGNAVDAAQDALLAALSNLQRFRGDAQLGTWLYRVAANAVLMTLRRERRAGQRTARALSQLPRESNWLHGCATPTQPHLRSAIDKLPERYRAVVLQCDLAERPLDEVAASLGVTVDGVRTRRLRAHRMLKDALRKAPEEK